MTGLNWTAKDIISALNRPDLRRKEMCHNWQCGNCGYKVKDCEHCEDWWYEPADEGRVAWKGR